MGRKGYHATMPVNSKSLFWTTITALTSLSAVATPDLKFDVVTFCCPCYTSNHLCQAQFDALNVPTTNGHYIAMGSDAHRLELATNGNALAIYYNNFNSDYSASITASQEAFAIQQYATNGFTSSGPRPDWVVLNEISSGTWPGNSVYRSWVVGVVSNLATSYGFKVIVYSPFPNPANNSSDWQAMSSYAWIGIENYLDGAQIQSAGNSVGWCQSQYQSSITSYVSLGVPRSQLMLGELFGQTTSGTSYGRSGVTSNEWDLAIAARSQAAVNIAFTGYLSYAWGGNSMLVSDDELVEHEQTYSAYPLPYPTPIHAPYIVLQPQSQNLPEGSDVTFTVYPAGTTPASFQWFFEHTNIPGATNSSILLTNITVTNHGAYSVVLSNSVGTLTSSNAFLNVSVPPPVAFEPFAPALADYVVGANLIGQTNAAGMYWTQAGPSSSNQPMIQGGNLVGGGLAGVSGNSVTLGGNGTSARFNLGTASTTGSWYYSILVRLANITGLSSSGVFWAGFNNSSGSQTTTPTAVGTRVVTKAAGSGYQVGLDKNSGVTSLFVFDPAVHTTNDTIFLVGCYTFTSTNDFSQLWVNPPAASFGLANPPPATLISTNGGNLSQIASFVLFNRNAAEPAQIIADEIRIGQSLASVTPPAAVIAPPSLNLSIFGNYLALTWATNAEGYLLESAPDLIAGPWSPVIGAVYVSGANYMLTNGIGTSPVYYRLDQPQ